MALHTTSAAHFDFAVTTLLTSRIYNLQSFDVTLAYARVLCKPGPNWMALKVELNQSGCSNRYWFLLLYSELQTQLRKHMQTQAGNLRHHQWRQFYIKPRLLLIYGSCGFIITAYIHTWVTYYNRINSVVHYIATGMFLVRQFMLCTFSFWTPICLQWPQSWYVF